MRFISITLTVAFYLIIFTLIIISNKDITFSNIIREFKGDNNYNNNKRLLLNNKKILI